MSEPVMTIDEAAFAVPIACSECGRQTDPRMPGVHFEVTGWAKKRKAGGLHSISFKIETGRLMCPICFMRRKQTGSAQQGRLL